MVEIERH